MGALTVYLQKEFLRLCPEGWTACVERKLFQDEMPKFLGYGPRVDVVLEKNDATQRLWIEFELSRADPVANHAKFATSHLFQPQPATDAFISMISPHVARGRRNLAASTVFLMRNIGMNAFQTVLFPRVEALEIKRLNHLDQNQIVDENLDVRPEIDPVFAISSSLFNSRHIKIHYVGDIMEAMLNIHSWNEGVSSENGREKWGKRTVAYFAFDPRNQSFAPAKFCAYTVIKSPSTEAPSGFQTKSFSKMTVEDYSRIDSANWIFDGRKAWMHLVEKLGMIKIAPGERSATLDSFLRWSSQNSDRINVHPSGPFVIVPPAWFDSCL